MTSANKIIDDVARVMSGAMGVAQDAKMEIEERLKSWVMGFVLSQDFVGREEFEAVSMMAANARAEVETLRAEIEAMKRAKTKSTDDVKTESKKASKK